MTKHRNKFYTQCRMKRKIEGKKDAYETLDSWIPTDIAKKGNIIKLRNSGSEEWSENWKVIEVWITMSRELVEAAERDFMKQREQSDV